MQVAIVALFMLVTWFIARTLKKIDANQTHLFEKYDDHEHRLSLLEGSHKARTEMNIHCTVEK
jgi:uncharacterized protein YdcH (DUF465 family)